MRVLDVGAIPTSLGEVINIKFHLDLIKDNYDQILLSFNKRVLIEVLNLKEGEDFLINNWNTLLQDLGKLFFSSSPYVLQDSSTIGEAGSIEAITARYGIPPHKANLSNLLCKGNSLNIGEYIVITTKVREVPKNNFVPLIDNFMNTINTLSNKYKIVILGEREVEVRTEYNMEKVFCLYDYIIKNLSNDKILDLTVPGLGRNVSTLEHIQQDCLIMKEAKFVITVGVGGNFCMATSVANMVIGFRDDNIEFTDKIYDKEYTDAIITKNWKYFTHILNKYAK